MLVDIYFFQSVGQQFNDGTRIILYIDLSPRQYVRAVTILCLLLDIAPQGICIRGGSRERAHPPRAPPKIGKNMIFWRKIVIFHTKYPKIFLASLRNWKKYDFF